MRLEIPLKRREVKINGTEIWLNEKLTRIRFTEAREDPCRDGQHDCVGQHMTCARDGTKFRCLCLDGYELIFTNELDTRGVCVGKKTCRWSFLHACHRQFTIFLDLNECSRNLHRCDQNAQCHNTEGAYTCICKPGFRGTGFKCISKIK